MAEKKQAAAAPAPAKAKKKQPGKLGMLVVMIGLGFLMPLMMPTVVLVLAGMFPTYFALATDSDPQKSGAVSVAAMNAAGVTPFVIDLWSKGQTLENAFSILGNANDWLVILGAAAIGQLIVYAVPQAIASLTLSHAETRMKGLRKNLDMLRDAWGAEVATTKPVDKIIQE